MRDKITSLAVDSHSHRKTNMGLRRSSLVALSVLSVSAFAVPTVSSAQGLPGGSYINSCSNINMVSGVLEATCQRADGSLASAALPNAAACRAGVTNSNGNLVCTAAPAAPHVTSQTSDGFTVFHNTCQPGQEYVVVVRPTTSEVALVLVLKAGQSIEMGVVKGASYQGACGTAPTDLTHFQYMNVGPKP
jgi:hypothetical protein